MNKTANPCGCRERERESLNSKRENRIGRFLPNRQHKKIFKNKQKTKHKNKTRDRN